MRTIIYIRYIFVSWYLEFSVAQYVNEFLFLCSLCRMLEVPVAAGSNESEPFIQLSDALDLLAREAYIQVGYMYKRLKVEK